MNWFLFMIGAYLFLVLRHGLAPVMGFDPGIGQVAPYPELMLAAFVALSSPSRTAVAAWLLLGLGVDLVEPYPGGVLLLSPHAIAYLVGGLVVVQFRPFVLRRHPLSLGFCTFVGGIVAQLVIVALFAVRSAYDPLQGPALTWELLIRCASVAYTAVLAPFIAVPLNWTEPLFAFQLPRKNRA